MKTKTTKQIFYKDWKGTWVSSELKPTQKNLALIKKHKALNGQATIQTILK